MTSILTSEPFSSPYKNRKKIPFEPLDHIPIPHRPQRRSCTFKKSIRPIVKAISLCDDNFVKILKNENLLHGGNPITRSYFFRL